MRSRGNCDSTPVALALQRSTAGRFGSAHLQGCLFHKRAAASPGIAERKPGSKGGYSAAKVRNASSVGIPQAVPVWAGTTPLSPFCSSKCSRPHAKALLIYGAGHLLHGVPGPIPRITNLLDAAYPGSTFVVITAVPRPESHEFERALKTTARPVLVSLGKPPFWGSASGSNSGRVCLFGTGPEVDVRVSPDR